MPFAFILRLLQYMMLVLGDLRLAEHGMICLGRSFVLRDDDLNDGH